GTFLRLEGITASVSYRRDRLKALLRGEITILDERDSAERWAEIREQRPPASGQIRWRISVPPSHGPKTVENIVGKIEARCFYDWAGGFIWLDIPYTEDASAPLIRGAVREGYAMLVHAPAELRSRVEVFQPQAPALAALTLRVKDAFDPKRLLNP